MVEYRHVQLPAHALVHLVHPAPERLGGRQQVDRFLIDQQPLVGNRKTLAPALAQRQAQPLLQILDVLADGRQADIQLQFGGAHAAAVDHGLEYPQQTQIHIRQLP